MRRYNSDAPTKAVRHSGLARRPGSSGGLLEHSKVSSIDEHIQLPKITGDDSETDIENEEIEESEISLPDPRKDVLGETSFFDKHKSNIMVAVRARPLNKKERAIDSRNVLEVLDGKMVILLNPAVAADDYLRANRNREKKYTFDCAFSEKASQRELYERTTKLLINGVLNGYNATVFAYGATGAGKTYTMTGTKQNPGIMVLTLNDLFQEANRNSDYSYTITMSYLEVYNENIRDLLSNSSTHLDLREDPVNGMVVSGISEIHAVSAEAVLELLQKGNKNRSTEATDVNNTSSRSHAILQVVAQRREKTDNISQKVRVAKLNLIDLAGSERASVTSNRGVRLLEGANINRSLLALANCINALVRGQKQRFVPYRDSKLTRLLKDSLGGNCRTVMIANTSPADFAYEDTHNTLKYANRAKNIKTKLRQNVVTVEHHVAEYTNIIKNLRSEISQLKLQLQQRRVNVPPPISSEFSYVGSSLSEGEEFELHTIRNEMMERLATLMQVKRQLLDIEEEIIVLANKSSDLEDEIDESSRGSKDSSPTRSDLRTARLSLTQVQNDLDSKKQQKQALQRKLQQMWTTVDQFREELPVRLPSKKLRKILEMEFRVHKLQLDKMELEDNTVLFRDIIKQKDLNIQRLEQQLQLRDEVLLQQANLLPPTQKHLIQYPNSLVQLQALQQGTQLGQNLLHEITPPRVIRRQNSWILPPPDEWRSARRQLKMTGEDGKSHDRAPLPMIPRGNDDDASGYSDPPSEPLPFSSKRKSKHKRDFSHDKRPKKVPTSFRQLRQQRLDQLRRFQATDRAPRKPHVSKSHNPRFQRSTLSKKQRNPAPPKQDRPSWNSPSTKGRRTYVRKPTHVAPRIAYNQFDNRNASPKKSRAKVKTNSLSPTTTKSHSELSDQARKRSQSEKLSDVEDGAPHYSRAHPPALRVGGVRVSKVARSRNIHDNKENARSSLDPRLKLARKRAKERRLRNAYMKS